MAVVLVIEVRYSELRSACSPSNAAVGSTPSVLRLPRLGIARVALAGVDGAARAKSG